MPFDLVSEPALRIPQAATLVPGYREGCPTHPSRLVRWIVNGVRADDGRVVRLKAMRLGGQWVTSAAALQRFAEAMTPGPVPLAPSQTPASRRKSAECASRELDSLGI